MSMPKIIIYQSVDAPAHEACAGFFFLAGKRLPMVFTGPNEEVVRRTATEWWKKETEFVDKRTLKKERA